MKKKFLTLLAFVCGLNGMKADEGMWMLSHISPKSMKVMKNLVQYHQVEDMIT